jgi:CDP-glycerol glycerophosphotransferase
MRADVVLYESFAGNGMLCNPEAIFRGLLNDQEFVHLQHIWVLRSRGENRETIAEFRGHPRVSFVRVTSFAYFRALATSGYLVNNATFPPQFGRRVGQIYLNTWHGTPLKKMGYDIGDQASRVANVIRNLLSADFLLSASTFMTQHLYESAHRLRGIYAGKVIELGYPRIDHQFADTATVAANRATLEAAGLAIGDREIILYAPTWKGTSFSRPQDDIALLAARLTELDSLIDSSRYVVLLKTHQVVHHFAHTVPGLANRLVPNTMPTNSVLAFTDVLVTDYSSIFFDFLAGGRPVLFLAPDINDYADYRGLYLEPQQWPGPVVATISDLATEINRLEARVQAPGNPNYAGMRDLITPHEDGQATARVIDVVFRGNSQQHPLGELATPTRRRVLVSAGTLQAGLESGALLKRLDEFDHDLLDITVMFANSSDSDAIAIQKRMNPQVRQLARTGPLNGRWLARRDSAFWEAEWQRCFGHSTFDEVIDLGTDSPILTELLRHAPAPDYS